MSRKKSIRTEAATQSISLEALGWSAFFETRFEPHRVEGLVPARIAREERDLFGVYSELGRVSAEVSGRMRHEARSRGELPAVGDWVAVAPAKTGDVAIIQAILPRRTRISRHQAGEKTVEQIIAANIDVVFLVSGLDGGRNFHIPTIERYLELVRESGAAPVVLLNKCDLCAEAAARAAEVAAVAPGVPIHAVSALNSIGLDALQQYLGVGKTSVFLGRSGVGKSMLINRLVGADLLPVGEVRERDRRGRHTTTWREMILLPAGGIVIDTPGIREIQMWTEADATIAEFPDLDTLALGCRFGDCRHLTEPGCAVKAAVVEGKFDAARLETWRRMQQERAGGAIKHEEKQRLTYIERDRRASSRGSRSQRNRPKRP